MHSYTYIYIYIYISMYTLRNTYKCMQVRTRTIIQIVYFFPNFLLSKSFCIEFCKFFSSWNILKDDFWSCAKFT